MEEHCDFFFLNIPKPNVFELLEPEAQVLDRAAWIAIIRRLFGINL